MVAWCSIDMGGHSVLVAQFFHRGVPEYPASVRQSNDFVQARRAGLSCAGVWYEYRVNCDMQELVRSSRNFHVLGFAFL